MSPRRRSLEGASGDGPAAASAAARPDGPLMIRDLDTGRSVPFEHADMLWQPMLVRDLDSNVLLPFSPDASQAGASQVLLNPPDERLRFLSCQLEQATLPPPLALVEYRLLLIERRRRERLFAACRRSDGGQTHYDVRWRDGALKFTGKLEVLPQPARGAAKLVELAMYDDYINYYGFPRELGFIRTKQLLDVGEAGALIELIIPRVSPDGAAAQFRVNAVPGQSMLSMYKQKRAREHMFVLRGRGSMHDSRAFVELRHRDERGNLLVAFQARRGRRLKRAAAKAGGG